MTMAKIRELYWIPRLRQLVKRVRTECWACKRFRAKSYEKSPPGKLPSTRTKGTTPFEVLGVDFAGPIRYKTKGKKFGKSYLVLYGCSLTRAVHLEVLKSLELIITTLNLLLKLYFCDLSRTTVWRQHSRHPLISQLIYGKVGNIVDK